MNDGVFGVIIFHEMGGGYFLGRLLFMKDSQRLRKLLLLEAL